ncbi:hypothetical protein [Schinkia azotoformans]|uniref:hypothetical protein n=1 Tax=Schinkia azotoformans TaxID=1454 RepID=UPI002DB96EC3|nr:hypothetical protein [Schinkia azotoformans]MEC1782109.1 hypothetical protein [Schinkia azotoformans]MED4329573.1 hypothetical protein [Schinkia azotoformans]
MSEDLRKALFEAVHLNPIWPDELIANAKLPNYEYVHYTNHGDGLIVEMKFEDEYVGYAYAYYYFDASEKLQKIQIKQRDEINTIYDRELVIAKAFIRLVEAEGLEVAKSIVDYKIAS